MSTFRQVQKLAEFYDAKGQPEQPITVIGTRAHLRKEFKPAERGGGTQGRYARTEDRSSRSEGRAAEHGLGERMTTWTPFTQRDNPAAHVRTDGLEFCLTHNDRSIAAQAAVQLEANRRRQNEREAMRGLAEWKGSMHRAGEALPQ
jgi:hypothetical protein